MCHERAGGMAPWSDATRTAPGGPPLVSEGRRDRFPNGPMSWGARSMRCCHSCASGHGEKVVTTKHVAPGNRQYARSPPAPIPKPPPQRHPGARVLCRALLAHRVNRASRRTAGASVRQQRARARSGRIGDPAVLANASYVGVAQSGLTKAAS